MSNIDGSFNNAFGNEALSQNVHASDNTAIGDLALANNDVTRNNVAYFNTAVGAQALFSNTDGNSNTALVGRHSISTIPETLTPPMARFTLFSNMDGGRTPPTATVRSSTITGVSTQQ